MAKKLMSLSVSPITWKLLFKSATLSLVLFFTSESGFNLLWTAVFLVLAVYFYLTSCLEKKIISYSFLIVLFLGIISSRLLITHGSFFLIPNSLFIVVILTLVFFLLFALANFLFKNRTFIYNILNFFLVFWLNLLIFYKINEWRMFGILVLFAGVFLLAKEALLLNDATWRKRTTVVSLVLSFLLFEIVFFISFLPLGFVNSAVVVAVFYLVFRDLLIANFSGSLNKKYFFEELVIFLAIFLAVLAISKWQV